jgi:hypothetical protein
MVYFNRVPQCAEPRGLHLLQEGPDEPEDAQDFPIPDDASYWDVFIPDDDEIDPLPAPGDFWIEPDE